MTPDALAPMAIITAKLIENALEEEQYSYAVDSMAIAAKLGVHPTRDLFLALLAIIYSQPEHYGDETDRRRRQRRAYDSARRTRKLNSSDPREIEVYTVCATMMLLGALVRDAPNAVRSFLPPMVKSEQEGAERAYEGAQEREWLRNAGFHDRSVGDARSRSSSISSTPIMRLAHRMLECKNVWQLLSLDTDQQEDGGDGMERRRNVFASARKTTARRQALDALRDGDGNLEEHDRRNMAQFDRPGTWMVVGLLNDLWKREIELLKQHEEAAPRWWCTHLARQFKKPDLRLNKQSAATEMDQVFDLIRSGFLAEDEGQSTKIAKRSVLASNLLLLLSQLVTHGVLDEGVFVRHCSDRILAADCRILPYTPYQVADFILVKAMTRFLKKAGTAAEGWDDATAEAYDACMHLPDLPATIKVILETFRSDASWTAHKDNYDKEELKEQARQIKESDGQIKAKQVETVLSDPTWQLFEAQSRRSKRKREDDDADRKLSESAVNAQYAAACVRLRAVDCIHARIGAQSYLLATVTQASCDPALQRQAQQYLQTISSSITARLQDAFQRDAAAIEACYVGILETCGRAQKARREEWHDVLNDWAAVLQKIQRRSSEAQVAHDMLEASRDV